ncbi:hypothetical protein BH18THE1_BH18THE1_04610 [soil metagenome]
MISKEWTNKLGSDTSMFFLLVVSIVSLLIEITVARLSNVLYSGPEMLPLSEFLFASGIIIFSIAHSLILLNVRKKMNALFGISQHMLKRLLQYMIIVQFILNGLMVIILIQILNDLIYKSNLIISIVSISYISGILNLTLLTHRFVRWILSGRSYVSLLFGIATCSILINTIFTFVFLVKILLSQPNEIAWHIGILSLPISDFTYTLSQFYSISFIISSLVTWLATITVLHTYSFRIGKVKFWTFAILPLLYIIGEFQSFYLPLLTDYRLANPVGFTIINILTFSTIRFGGALFFGFGFWAMSRKIQQKSLKTFLNISAYGLILLFVTNQASLLLNTLFPPLGLTTASFVGLSSFLLLVGTYSAALSVSYDVNIRKAIRTSLEKESQLIGHIGNAELQAKLSSKVRSMLDKFPKSLQDTQMESSLTDEDIKNYTNEVIHELIRRKNLK